VSALDTGTVRDPTVKRTLCRGCDTVLIPGLSATVRVHGARSSSFPCLHSSTCTPPSLLTPYLGSGTHGHVITTSCLRCKLPRRIPAPPVPIASPQCAPHDSEDTAMKVDKVEDPIPPKSKRRRRPRPRPPPLFEREGHVIFRGNVQIEPKPP
jgi:ribonuclease P protein subunit RPR2